MISARDAVKLFEESEGRLNQYLDTEIEKKVRDAAINGKRKVEILLGCEPEYFTPRPDQFQLAVIARLKKQGFAVNFSQYGESYIPRAYEDNENAVKHCNYGYVISW